MGSGNEILDMYIYETGTLLEQLETIVLEAEKADTFSQENVNEIFRIMHTIKGSSAMMEFDSLATVAHRIEDMFFIIREGTMSVVSEENRPALFDVVFQSIDFFRGEVEKVESGEPLDKDIDSFLTNINTLISKIKGEEPAQPETPLIFADNGVQARTLTPSSPEGYEGGIWKTRAVGEIGIVSPLRRRYGFGSISDRAFTQEVVNGTCRSSYRRSNRDGST